MGEEDATTAEAARPCRENIVMTEHLAQGRAQKARGAANRRTGEAQDRLGGFVEGC